MASMLGFALVFFMTPISQADEGFWLFNAPPLKQLREKYHFTPDAAWLEHIQKSSVRFDSGGSGSFVSADGLVITNHHVGADALQKFGDIQHNYIRDGFTPRHPPKKSGVTIWSSTSWSQSRMLLVASTPPFSLAANRRRQWQRGEK